MSAYLPTFINVLEASSLLPLANSSLQLARFDSSLIEPDDYQRCAVQPIEGIAKRQAEHLAGRLCARQALTSLGVNGIPARGEQGQPIWPTGVCGSISHSNGMAAALIADCTHWCSLGLDLEPILSPARARRLAAAILTPTELEHAQTLSDTAFALHISQAFSLKESLFKALFPLINKRFYFHHAEVVQLDSNHACLQLMIDLSGHWRAGSQLLGCYNRDQEMLISAVAIPSSA